MTATSPALPRSRRPELARWLALPVVGAVLTLLMMSSAAPSPMYVIYQGRWHFSSAMLTVIFAVYAIAVLGSLLLFGSLSDATGRRPVLCAAVALALVSMLIFALADGVAWLIVARIVQGIAVGTATGAVAAALIELSPPNAPGRGTLINAIGPTLGQGAGSLLAGVLVQYGPAPTVLPYVLLLGGFAVLVALAWVLPETAPPASGPIRLRPRKIGVPAGAGRGFAVLAISMLSLWAIGGLVGSLGPSFVAGLLHTSNHVLGGLVMGVVAGFGTIAQLLAGRLAERRAVVVGTTGLVLGVVGVVTAFATGSAVLFFSGCAVLGLGWGAAFLGAFRAMSALAEPERRGELLAAVYVVAYLGMSLPAIAAGIFAGHIGLRGTAIAFFAGVGVLALVAVVLLPLANRRTTASTSTAATSTASTAKPAPCGGAPSPCGIACHVTAGVTIAEPAT